LASVEKQPQTIFPSLWRKDEPLFTAENVVNLVSCVGFARNESHRHCPKINSIKTRLVLAVLVRLTGSK
jgi:hypothetical protein